jgi:hemolysin-activating ACP:hemolysin acyltransferase
LEGPFVTGAANASETPAPVGGEQPAYRPIVFHDIHVTLGIACRLMMHQPAFSDLPFGSWMGVLVGQAERGHVRFFIDRAEAVVGFFGYAICMQADADAWAFRNAPLTDAQSRGGDCVLFNAWVGVHPAVRATMVEEMRRVSAGKAALYYKRFYPDGRVRPIRLPLTEFHVPTV